jgi:signal transduction histidine kinase
MLMFINRHDLTLLLLLLGFGTAISFVFGYSVTGALVADLADLGRAARRLAGGDLTARVGAQGSDEIARLAATFDRMAGQLEASFERERALDAGRREMVAAISHDLRTPLTTIRAMVEAITDGVVSEPDEVRRYLDLVRGEVRHLSHLIDDLFELSQIESGSLTLDLAPTPLPELLTQTLEVYQAPARDGGVALEHATEADVPPVAADAARLGRVIRNLVDNAIRHTPAGGRVRVEARAQGETVQVSVSDTGPGLAPGEAERIFERFYRGERARSRDGGSARSTGAGLGLTIARGLVQAHGGRIWAERAGSGSGTGGSGAVFRFTIPVAGT